MKTPKLTLVSRPNSFIRAQWAIDLETPENQAAQFSKSVPPLVRYLMRQGAIIEPVHVLRMASNVSTDFTAKWQPEYSIAAEDAMDSRLGEMRITGTMPPKIILSNSLSIREAADALIADAVRSKAQFIIAQTHSRRGMSRMFLGSFAETLLFRSKLPVLLIGKEMKRFNTFKKILFPTDFGNQSRAQLNHVLDTAETFGSKITLFHSVQHPIQPIGTGFYPAGPLGPFVDYVQRQFQLATKKADTWVEIAQRRGLAMNYIIDEKGQSIWEQVVETAEREGAGLIAMDSQSGPIASTLLGSVARQVVRHAPCPVLVLKSKSIRAAQVPTEVSKKPYTKAA